MTLEVETQTKLRLRKVKKKKTKQNNAKFFFFFFFEWVAEEIDILREMIFNNFLFQQVRRRIPMGEIESTVEGGKHMCE